jgi:aspartate racemase
MAAELAAAGADAVVLGCTEVPLVLDAQNAPCPLVNATEVLAAAVLAAARA